MKENFDAFDNYVYKFDIKDDAIKRKYNHSYRVYKESEKLAKYLKCNDNDVYIAVLIGLLHDFGRFEQWTKYKTYNDLISINHALLGTKLLFDDNLIKDYKLSLNDYELVRKAIELHNVHVLNEDLDARTLLHSKIIRDADKIDILFEISNFNIIKLEEDDNKITNKIATDFFNHQSINKKDIKSKNDEIIMSLGIIYDFNFDYSKKLILEKDYLSKIFNNLNNKELFKPYFDEISKYLKGEILNDRE